MEKTLSKQKRKFFLFLPVFVIPFCCLIFHLLGGGQDRMKKVAKEFGLNTEFPSFNEIRRAFKDKLKTYEEADKDSVKKEQDQRQDPYRKPIRESVHGKLPAVKAGIEESSADLSAALLQRQLEKLQQTLHSPAPVTRQSPLPLSANREGLAEVRAPDPQLDRLNTMLDKVLRIQHPEERPASGHPVGEPERPKDEVLPADSSINSIAAIIPEDQVLTSGTTILLRLTDSVRLRSEILPPGELIYGVTTISNDRLLVHISSFRRGHSLYSVDWQAYDLDGLMGIHIPGMLERDVAKQSADQGVNSLNVLSVDPNIGAQAAGAGIQAAKTFLGRKVRQVRVVVRSGYQVLLRDPRAKEIGVKGSRTSAAPLDSLTQPPEWVDGPVLERSRDAGVEVCLRNVGIDGRYLWFGLEWKNHSPIGYEPGYVRWTIRDRRAFRRTALQEQTLQPVHSAMPEMIAGDSVCRSFTGFRPFAIGKDKVLVVEIGEKGGGRTLVLVIPHQRILNARIYAKSSQ
jgi:hypothetical protein